MRYAIIIPDGAADVALDELDGRTPMEAANIPNMDWIAASGKDQTFLLQVVPAERKTDSPAGSGYTHGSFHGINPLCL